MHRALIPLIAVLSAFYGLSEPSSADPLILTATLEPAQSNAVYAHLSGTIERIAVQEGDTVAVGDTLALLDATELHLIEKSAGIAFQKIQTQLFRAEQLHSQGGISTQTLESLQYDAEQAKIRWQRAVLYLNRATIISPAVGIIAETHIQPGDLTTTRMLLFTIINPDTLKTILFVPVDQVASIHLNQPVTALSLADSTKTVNGIITHISPVIAPESGTCRAIARFPNADHTIKPGTVARVQINKKPKEQ